MDFTNGPAMPLPTGNNNNNADSSSGPGLGGSSSSGPGDNTTNSPAELQPDQTGRVVGVVLTAVFAVLIFGGFATWFVLRVRRRRSRLRSVKFSAMSLDGTGAGTGTGAAMGAESALEEARIAGLTRPAPPGQNHAPQHSWDFVDANPDSEMKAKLSKPPPSRDSERLRLSLTQPQQAPSQHSHTSESKTKHDEEDDDARSDLSAPPGVEPPAYSHRLADDTHPQHAGEEEGRKDVS
ncbi:hypothetical protein CONPUDRAFT_73378 [Coniophora puteana RWD-64-598 SS2]|uniref:Uncharacterized protein n=1 Tax=Coniophora puteana (strain RWD-64-598) TaxID=741705 RepID=A0A5M3MMD3_CONPW|nr:uncharacterized protein CONPUDRAFT_73378 [Coniophora puteana RWD-64-598 SS2]EIW80196.1 hypothetical protein CONPUDRAFT_73378 [Coniophora puteana RWD-64-598 SS2]